MARASPPSPSGPAPPSALIHHFGSKDGLVQAVLEEADRRALERLSVPPDAETTLDQAFDWFVRDAEHTAAAEREPAALHTTLTAENLEPGSAQHTWFRDRDRGRALRAHLNALFARAAADGTARSDLDPAVLATAGGRFHRGRPPAVAPGPGRGRPDRRAPRLLRRTGGSPEALTDIGAGGAIRPQATDHARAGSPHASRTTLAPPFESHFLSSSSHD
ncbi:hypothetical protein [Streptomyces sp. NBC_01314]|uniref:hypothetical protein n=1 Tax=Streptomyces sp. NBC_01314 TaxID=2903821 RepID=UPI0030875C26|nr:hypothetical protein OG622_02760 [Streptomyces sp. NBC_01314]